MHSRTSIRSHARRLLRSLSLALPVLALAAGTFLSGPSWFGGTALATDRITLKDGTVLEGTIVREVQGMIWLKHKVGGLEVEKFLRPEEISEILRDADAKEAAKPAATTDAKGSPAPGGLALAPVANDSTPKGMVLTLGEVENNMVGVYMTADILRRAIPLIEQEMGTSKDGERIVVLRIHSGGGLGDEVQRLSDVIHNDYKTRWRTVAWISSAISAAAMTAHAVEEIYFMTNANYGACTGFYGSLDRPVEGIQLEMSLAQMERISIRGGYDPLIMRAMQVQQPLSATMDADGRVKFFPDITSGQIIVNREREILTFNAETARAVNFSKGTADTIEELARAMKLPEIHWVGERVRGVPWPVSKAERLQTDFRRRVKSDENSFESFVQEYQLNAETASGQPCEERGVFVGKARQALDKIRRMVRNNPNSVIMRWGEMPAYTQWMEERDREIKRIAECN